MSTVVDDGEAQSSPRFSDADQQMYNITFRSIWYSRETERQSSSERQNQKWVEIAKQLRTEKLSLYYPSLA